MQNSDSVDCYPSAISGCRWVLVLVTFCFVTACGSGEDKPSEKDNVYLAISGVADAAGAEDTFVALFVEKTAAPRDRRADYARFSYKAASIVVDGDSATAEVQIIQPLDDAVLSTATWKLKKQGEKWLLSEAALNLK